MSNMNIGDLIKKRAANKKAITELNQTVKTLNKENIILDEELIRHMDGQGTNKVSNDDANISIKEEVFPKVISYEEIQRYTLETGDFSIWRKQLTLDPLREHWKLDATIPGVEPFVDRKIVVRLNKSI